MISGLEKSKIAAIYAEIKQKVEKLTAILYIVTIKITVPSLLVPIFVMMIFKYFTTEMESDDFILPFPLW